MDLKPGEDGLDISKDSASSVILDKEDQPFYKDGAKYWTAIEPTVDGMLGGLGFLSDIDIKNSERFLKTLLKVNTVF
jgi:hypothetical protein